MDFLTKNKNLMEYYLICEEFHKMNLKGKDYKPLVSRKENKRFSITQSDWNTIPNELKGTLGTPHVYIVSNDPEDYEGWVLVNIK